MQTHVAKTFILHPGSCCGAGSRLQGWINSEQLRARKRSIICISAGLIFVIVISIIMLGEWNYFGGHSEVETQVETRSSNQVTILDIIG